MFRNVFYDSKKGMIHLWEEIKGERLYTEIPWVPYFFQKTDSKTNIKSIFGDYVEKKEFSNYSQYNNAQKEMINIFENKTLPILQFLSERYNGISDDDIMKAAPNLKIYSLDIEVHSGNGGFPHPENADFPITVINIKHFKGDSYSWGLFPYNGKTEFTDNHNNPIKLHYYNCKNELDLIKNFMLWINKNAPDVLTGYNIVADNKTNQFGGFDLPYIINRSKKLFGDETKIFNKLSPINKVRHWNDRNSGKMVVDIAGVSIIDYMAIYKWFSPKNQSNYRLDTICKDELGVSKLDYSDYGSLLNLYKQNWDLYVEYNVVDDIRIEDLENKLGYIKLTQSISLLCKTPLKAFNASVQQIEGLFLTHYRRNNLCAPYFAGGQQQSYPAAYVKEPHKGIKPWVIDIDITSSYPTSIIIMNMSPETYIGRIMTLSDEDIIKCCENKKFTPFQFIKKDSIVDMKGDKLARFNKIFNKKLISVAPCGTVFSNAKRGIYPSVIKSVFMKRKAVKKQMLDMKKEMGQYKESDPEKYQFMKEGAQQLYSTQLAQKLIINQSYGVLAVPFCRFFNKNMAEAVCSTSKHTIKQGEVFLNRLLNDPSKDDEFKTVLDEVLDEVNDA